MKPASAIAVGLGLLLLAAAWLLRAQGRSVPPPPAAPDPTALDPEVGRILAAAIEAVRRAPADAPARAALAMDCQAHGLGGFAITGYRQALELDPTQARWWYLLGCELADAGALEEALAALRSAAALDGTYAPVHWRAGQVLLEQGRTDEARAAFERAAALPSGAEAGTVGLARAHMARGEAGAAAALLATLVERHPAEGSYRRLLAEARGEAPPAARPGAPRAPPAWPDPWRWEVRARRAGHAARIESAAAALDEGRPQQALEQLAAALDARPDDVVAMNHAAEAHFALRRHAQAMALLERALSLDPRSPATHLNLAYGYEHASPPDLARSLRHAQEAAALNPSLGPAHLQVGRVHALSGRLADSAQALARALAAGAGGPDDRLMYGQILSALGQWSEAARVLAGVVELAPGARALAALARARMELGDLEDAETLLDRAATIDAGEPAIAVGRSRLGQLRAEDRR
jgi:tetratricopeptide (TPR) repeat protein